MNEQDRRQKIVSTLKAKGFYPDTGSSLFAFDGKLFVGNNDVRLRLELPDTLFSELPVVTLVDRTDLQLDAIAHLEHLNRVCYGSIELLRLDPADPGGSVLLVLQEAQKAIEASLAGRFNDEIARELTRYWNGRVFYILSPIPTTLFEGRIGIENKAFSVARTVFEPKETKRAKQLTATQGAIWIPAPSILTIQHGIIEPKTVEQLDHWWTGNGLLQIVDTKKLHENLLSGRAVIVSASNAIVGFELDPSPQVRQLLDKDRSRQTFRMSYLAANGQKVGVKRLVGVDSSLDYIGARNIAEKAPPPQGKKHRLIGLRDYRQSPCSVSCSMRSG